MNKDIFMLCKSIREDEYQKNKSSMVNIIGNIKFDGERILAVKKDNDVMLVNRGWNLRNDVFSEVVEDLKQIDGDFIIDGEVISKDDNFTKLMTRARVKDKEKLKQRIKDVPIIYMAFDILKYDNVDVRGEKLKSRLEKLKLLFTPYNDSMKNVEVAEYGDVDLMLQRAKDENREGIIIKNWNGVYESKKRSDYWLKLKFFKEEEFKAVEYEVNNAGIKVLDEQKRSVQITGEQHHEVKELLDLNGEVLIEIQYLTKSKDGQYRFPSYKRIVGSA